MICHTHEIRITTETRTKKGKGYREERGRQEGREGRLEKNQAVS